MFAISADLHLRRNAWVNRPGLAGDAYWSLKQIVEFCIGHGCPLVLLGDVFDNQHPDAEAVTIFSQQMQRMAQENLDVYYIQGNHERSPTLPWCGVHPAVKHIHDRIVRLDGVDWYGLDWTPRDQIQAKLASLANKRANGLFAHQVWQEFTGFNPECSFADIPENIRYLATGDYHESCVRTINSRSGPLVVLSPGSICLQAKDESPKKCFFVYNDGESGQFSSRPLMTRSVCRADVLTDADLSQFAQTCKLAYETAAIEAAGLPAEIRKPILLVTYDPQLQTTAATSAHSVIQEAARDFHVFLTPKIGEQITEISVSEPTYELSGGEVLQTALVDAEPNVSVRNSVIRLLNCSGSIPKEIATMAQEALEQ